MRNQFIINIVNSDTISVKNGCIFVSEFAKLIANYLHMQSTLISYIITLFLYLIFHWCFPRSMNICFHHCLNYDYTDLSLFYINSVALFHLIREWVYLYWRYYCYRYTPVSTWDYMRIAIVLNKTALQLLFEPDL